MCWLIVTCDGDSTTGRERLRYRVGAVPEYPAGKSLLILEVLGEVGDRKLSFVKSKVRGKIIAFCDGVV